jgi:hypothetical protein
MTERGKRKRKRIRFSPLMSQKTKAHTLEHGVWEANLGRKGNLGY